MSTSLLHHGFGLKDQEYLKTEYKEGHVYFHIKTKDSKLQCSNCSSFHVVKKGVIQRTFRTVPIGLKPVFLKASVQRLECKDCKLVRQERLKYVDLKKKLHQVFRPLCDSTIKEHDNSGCFNKPKDPMENSQEYREEKASKEILLYQLLISTTYCY